VVEAQGAPRARVEAVLGRAAPVEVVLDGFDSMYWSFRYLQGREAWRTDGALIERFAPPLGPGVAQRFAWAREVSDAQVAEAAAFRARFRAHLAALLGSDGVLLMPTMPDIAPLASADEAGLEDYRNRATRMLCIAGLAGFAQLSLPLGSRLGAPLGISLLGPAGSDRSLVRLVERVAAAESGKP
ncbi:MAG: amidase family protein, partial [Caldimonas sp.]